MRLATAMSFLSLLIGSSALAQTVAPVAPESGELPPGKSRRRRRPAPAAASRPATSRRL